MFAGEGKIIGFDGIFFPVAHGDSSTNWDDWDGPGARASSRRGGGCRLEPSRHGGPVARGNLRRPAPQTRRHLQFCRAIDLAAAPEGHW